MRLFIVIFSFLLLSDLSAQRELAPLEMQADLAVLHKAWTSLHPGLYRYNTPGEIEREFRDAKERCMLPLLERQFYILLSQLAQQVKCGHTYLNPLNLDKETALRVLPQKVLPVFFEITGQKRIIVTQIPDKASPLRCGDEIIAINNIPARRIMDSLLTVSRADGNHALGKKYFNMNETPDEADGYSLFDIYFPLFFNAADQWLLTVKHYGKKKTERYQINLTSRETRMTAYRDRYGEVPSREKSWAYRLIGRHTAYVKFGTFAFWNSDFNEKKYVDSVFREIGLHPGIKNLIIDIRNNEGGDNTGDYILSYVIHRPLGCDDPDHRCFRFLTVPDTLLPYLTTWDKSFKAPKDPSLFFVNRIGLYEQRPDGKGCAYIQPQAKPFNGKVFLLTNAKNSSAGYEMARNVKVNKLGVLIGETTGGSQQGINGGQFFFLTLPYSKFEIDLPLIYNYHPNKPDKGIQPDIEIKSTQRSIFTGKDLQLKYVLSKIGNY